MIIHADGVHKGEKARVETFVVGHDIQKGEKSQWVVEGGKYKSMFFAIRPRGLFRERRVADQ